MNENHTAGAPAKENLPRGRKQIPGPYGFGEFVIVYSFAFFCNPAEFVLTYRSSTYHLNLRMITQMWHDLRSRRTEPAPFATCH